VLREALLGVSHNASVKKLIIGFPPTRELVSAFVAGESTADAVRTTKALAQSGRSVTIDHLGEDTTSAALAEQTVAAYLELLDQLQRSGLAAGAEFSVKLSAIGQDLAENGAGIALTNAQRICRAAYRAGAEVTIDMEDHTKTDATLTAVSELRREFPDVGVVLQAYLKRTEDDCRRLACEGSRVRLVKGAYSEPEAVAYTDRHEIDKAFVRCAKILINGDGYPMIASHDPRLTAIAETLAIKAARKLGDLEFQMLYGIGVPEQERLLHKGHRVRVYLPYGTDWYGYLVRRLAERPANLALLVRAVAHQLLGAGRGRELTSH
jgi:proline dehydrogenase